MPGEDRIVIAERRPLQLAPLDTVLATQAPSKGVAFEMSPVSVDVEIVGRNDPLLRRRAFRQRLMLRQTVAYDRRQRCCDAGGVRRIRVAEISDEPRRQLWKITPFQEQRLVLIKQHPWRFGQQPRSRDRHA